jgi:uncharacterized protein YjbI with pentapeptide repeats
MKETFNKIINNESLKGFYKLTKGKIFYNEVIDSNDLSGLTFLNLTFVNCKFINITFQGTIFVYCSFKNCNFINTLFRKAELEYCNFQNSIIFRS